MKEIRMQPFDGTQPEIPPTERRVVAQTFTSGIQQILEEHSDYVDTITSSEGTAIDRLYLEVPIENDTRKVTLYYGGTAQIRITEPRLQDEDFPKEHHYKTKPDGTDGIVIRTDFPSKTISLDEFTSALNSDEVQQSPDPFLNLLKPIYDQNRHDITKSAETEEVLGMNSQPVGLSEIASVLDVAADARPKQVTGDDLLRRVYRKMYDPLNFKTDSTGEAADLFDQAVTRTLHNGAGERIEETTVHEGITWSVQVAKATGEHGETTPYVGIYWKQADPYGVTEETRSLEYKITDGALVETFSFTEVVVFPPGIVKTDTDTTEIIGDLPTARDVRNFLIDRTTTYNLFSGDSE